MIGLFISMAIQLVMLAVQLAIILVRLFVSLVVMLVALVSNTSHRSRRSSLLPSIPRRGISGDLRWAIFERDGYACAHCGSRRDLSVDHIYPVSLGGSDDPTNLQTLCRSCNCTKGARV